MKQFQNLHSICIALMIMTASALLLGCSSMAQPEGSSSLVQSNVLDPTRTPTATYTFTPISANTVTPTPAKLSHDTLSASTPTSGPSATPTPGPSATPTQAILLNETFSRNDGNWTEFTNSDSIARISEDKLNIFIIASDVIAWSDYTSYHFTDFILEVDATHISGPYNHEYGVVFRKQNDDNLYEFAIANDAFSIFERNQGEWTKLKDWTQSQAINTPGQTNRLKIVARDSRFEFYANDILLTTVTDASFTNGGIGLVAAMYTTGETVVAFDNLIIYGKEKIKPPPATPTPRPTPTPAYQEAYITLNKGDGAVYRYGETIEMCFSLNIPARAEAKVYAPDGSTYRMGNWPALGRNPECASGPAVTRGGWNYIELIAYDQTGNVETSTRASFLVD